MKIKTTFTFAFLVVLMTSCGTMKKSNTEAVNAANASDDSKIQTIENIKWVLPALDGQLFPSDHNDGRAIYFTLNPEDHRVNGFSGCNRFMGSYKIGKDNRISFSKMASTRMACPDSQINESAILNIFETADSYSISADYGLTLYKADKSPSGIFVKEELAPIVEKYWKLKILDGQEVQMVENQTREIFITLKAQDSAVTGFAGCNSITGTYVLENGNKIRFNRMATTLRLCPDVAIKESDFLNLFDEVDNYAVNNDELTLYDGQQKPLAVFEAVYFN